MTSIYPPNHVPLPHQIQPHFYRAPNVDLGSARHAEGRADGGTFYCGFDNLATFNHEGSRVVETVLLVGNPGGLATFKVGEERLESVGSLNGSVEVCTMPNYSLGGSA
jgi:hypothetical protein